jgi:diamine N-acetyltransferase
MHNVSIEKVQNNDLERLQAIGTATFMETFAPHNTEENMRQYLATAFAPEKLAAELAEPHVAYYFACVQGEAVGYLKVNYGRFQTELSSDEDTAELERIYVLQKFHGQEFGLLLLQKAIELGRNAQKKYLWLGVWEKNERAIRFYQKHGFQVFDQHVFVLGDDAQTDWMMRLIL